ncbi:MAG: hypothetical protein PHD76_09635 [Methylacidiphilales bacterium]|nr:hypothetical protein [Candidatus Methylacidiphilales bacterium]
MWFFKRPSDPLAEELHKLEREQRKLEEEMSRIEETMQSPPSQSEPDADEVEKKKPKGAVFSSESPLFEERPEIRRNRNRLKIQNRMARNRFIFACVLLLILILVVLRALS